MNRKIRSALISVFYKEGLGPIVKRLQDLDVKIYSTGGTLQYIQQLGTNVTSVEELTGYPSILGGRVKTLHPTVFGGILGKRDDETHLGEMKQYQIPEIDLVIVDLYPFEETVASNADEKSIIEKIDVGGPSMIRGAAKNFKDVMVIAAKKDYTSFEKILADQKGETTLEQRKDFAARAFEVVGNYDVAIAKYFHRSNGQDASDISFFLESAAGPHSMRYGENPHQGGIYYGDLNKLFDQLNGKELSYNNLVDVDAAIQLITEFQRSPTASKTQEIVFAIIKHTNVCGIASRPSVRESWDAAIAGDPESAFGGVLVSNGTIDKSTAEAISEIFFEVLIAPGFDADALSVLKSKKNRILLTNKVDRSMLSEQMFRSLLNGVLVQSTDKGNFIDWKETGGRETTDEEKTNLQFANIVCKHLKSNAIALVKNMQLVGKGCGQTSRIDSLRQAIEKARQFKFELHDAVMASDAFFPFDDCVKMGHQAGIRAFIQPGGSIRDNDSIKYCQSNGLALVMTGMRHFKH